MIPRDTLELIQSTAQAAKAAQVFQLPGDGSPRVFVNHNGELKEFNVLPPFRQHVVYWLDDLVGYAKRAEEGDSPVIWHSPHGVVLILDDTDRRARVTFPLLITDQFKALSELVANLRGMDQRSFVFLLKNTLGLDPVHVTPWRKLDWRTQIAASGETAAGRDRMGREVMAEVTGTAALPEELTVCVPLYEQRGERERYPIRCSIEIDAPAQKLALCPLPGEIEEAIDRHQDYIRQRLVEELPDLPIYYGTP